MEPARLLDPRLWFTTNPIARALVLSLALHLVLLSAIEGAARLRLLEWMQRGSSTAQQFIRSVPPAEQEPMNLTFIEVDPVDASPEVPNDAKYYAARNTQAANPEVVIDSSQANIEGSQDKVPRTFDSLQPSPVTAAPPPEPQQAETPPPAGDIAMIQPEEAAPRRPRTVAEALAQRGQRDARAMNQEGGVARRGSISLVDAIGSPLGEYDRILVDAIDRRWKQILRNSQVLMLQGKVEVEFRLNSNGQVTHVKILNTEVGEMLAVYCRRAVSDPSPYPPWPGDLQRLIAKPHRDIKVTFHYEYY